MRGSEKMTTDDREDIAVLIVCALILVGIIAGLIS